MADRYSKPDTDADREIREVLDSTDVPAFVVTAGAGSGKTTSLIKALSYAADSKGTTLTARGQQIACITYTEVAANEIFEDAGSSPVAAVSTVHSFLWSVVSPFHRDIASWAKKQVAERKSELVVERDNFGPRVQQKKRDEVDEKIASYEQQERQIDAVSSFRYGFGPDLGNGVLGHEDVIKLGTTLLNEKPRLRSLLAGKYPVVLVDESQDTFPEVVDALSLVNSDLGARFRLGFFGDPMQKVYSRGAGRVELLAGWKDIKKRENFRSSRQVLQTMNDVRALGDGLKQVTGLSEDEQREGESIFVVLPADDHRVENLDKVKRWLDDREEGRRDARPVPPAKVLVIGHRMAARRSGFLDLYSAFHDSRSSSLPQAFDEGTAWPMRFFVDSVLSLAELPEPRAVDLLARDSPLIASARARAVPVREVLATARQSFSALREIADDGGPGSVGRMIDVAISNSLVEVDPRILHARRDEPGDISEATRTALRSFFECDVEEVRAYRQYMAEESPYSTQQGAKGTEHARVIVVLDDEEGRHNQFQYDKLLKLRAPTSADEKAIREGRETNDERTRRLLYVCVSRSTDKLAVVLVAKDVDSGVEALKRASISGATNPYIVTSAGAIGRHSEQPA